jgi:multiple sugar transport system permease protein
MASSNNKQNLKAIGRAAPFLAPNILGFLAFTLIPVVISFAMAFTNWDLTLHNAYTEEPIRFVGIDNFLKLFQSPYFWQYFGNTLFLMLGIPFGIAGSLGAAILLNNQLKGPNGSLAKPLIIVAASLAAAILLVAIGMKASAFAILITGVAGLMLIGGTMGGTTVYRTLYYLPHFTQGVAIFILWKKLYSPQTGPINRGLFSMLNGTEQLVQSLPLWLSSNLAALPMVLLVVVLFAWLRAVVHKWRDGELGPASILISTALMGACLYLIVANFSYDPWVSVSIKSLSIALVPIGLAVMLLKKEYKNTTFTAIGSQVLFSMFMVSLMGVCLLMILAVTGLPGRVTAGLQPPDWLSDYNWAKPSLIFMGLWAAIGSNNMILYLAGLSNISPEYYEAADIDGASRWQKFCFITWPQLAPVTFFIVVMSVIYGLQGGFEMARTMTGGGPAGATTTLSYFIYSEGFETGRLGYASAVAWVLFLMVFLMSMINWKFGNKYVSE